jgi:erythritol kinase
MTSVRIGLDVGTTAIKAAAYLADGRLVARADRASSAMAAEGGRSEQDMDAVWQGSAGVLRDLVQRLDGTPVAALGLCGQGDGLWLVGADGEPVGPAMLWNDTQAARDVAELSASGAIGAVGLCCHTALWPGTSGAIWRWLGRHDPARRAAAAHAFTCADWVGSKLTGVIATDLSNASIPFLDIRTGRYAEAALAALDCADLGPLLPAPRRADSCLGGLTEAAAAATGLPPGLPVSVPTLDISAMALGLGLTRPGPTLLIMGTTAVVAILTDTVEPTEAPVGASALHPTSDAIIRIFAPTSGAAAFDWFAALHPLSLGGATAEAVAEKLNALVATVPPGANGVTFLPYLNGERAPFVAPEARAAFHGMTARTTKADLARAVLEGTALSLRHCFVAEDGLPREPVRLTGGGSRNPMWCQIIADVIGVPVVTSAISDHGLWGAAMLGAAAAGLGPIDDLVARSEPTRTYTPDPAAVRAYGPVFDRYRRFSDASRELNAAVAPAQDAS